MGIAVTSAIARLSGLGHDRAARLLAAHSREGVVDPRALARAIDAAPAAQRAALRAQIDAALTPVERGRLAAAATAVRAPDLRTVALDVGQVALDIVGIFEPTPIADLTNAGISLARGDGTGALMSAAGAIPYLGDLAKAGKLGRWAQTVGNAVELALTNNAARRALAPALRQVGDALNAIPRAVLARAPAAVQETIAGLRAQIARLSSSVAAEVAQGVGAASSRLGVAPDRLRAILDLPKGQRPAVSTYMSAAQRQAHLAAFADGVVRITSRRAYAEYGTLGPPGGFVTSARDFNAIVREARGNLTIVEQRLGLSPGTLRSSDTMIALVDRNDAARLRIPDGNEPGANDRWVPGGYTSGNVVEAVMDFRAGTPFREIRF